MAHRSLNLLDTITPATALQLELVLQESKGEGINLYQAKGRWYITSLDMIIAVILHEKLARASFDQITPVETRYPTLEAYREGRLATLWQEHTQAILAHNQKLSPNRAGELAAARIASEAGKEYEQLEESMSTQAEFDLYEWLVANYEIKRELIDLSGTRTLLVDMEMKNLLPNTYPPSQFPHMTEKDGVLQTACDEMLNKNIIIESESLAEHVGYHWSMQECARWLEENGHVYRRTWHE